MEVILYGLAILIITIVLLIRTKIKNKKFLIKGTNVSNAFNEQKEPKNQIIIKTYDQEINYFKSIWGKEKPKGKRKKILTGSLSSICKTLLFNVVKEIYKEKEILYIDCNLYKTDKFTELLNYIFERLGLINKQKDLLTTILKGIGREQDGKIPKTYMINLIIETINEDKIKFICDNCHTKLNDDISTIISEIISKINNVTLITEPIINGNIKISNDFDYVYLKPNVCFDTMLYYSTIFKSLKYNRKEVYGNNIEDILKYSEREYITKKLEAAGNDLYRDIYKLCGGNYKFIENLDIKNIEEYYSEDSILKDKKRINSIYNSYYKNTIEEVLDEKAKKLLFFIAIPPFSIPSDDIINFCNEHKIDRIKAIDTLKKFLLIYKTNEHHYVNVLAEILMLDEDHSHICERYFRNGIEEIDGENLPVYKNCDEAERAMRDLINEALLERFYKGHGYYVTNPLRRIVNHLDEKFINNYRVYIVKWAKNYYKDKRKANNDSFTELAYLYFENMDNNEVNKVDSEILNKLIENEIEVEKKIRKKINYYSLIQNKVINIENLNEIKINNKEANALKLNILYCYYHILLIKIIVFISNIDDIKTQKEASYGLEYDEENKQVIVNFGNIKSDKHKDNDQELNDYYFNVNYNVNWCKTITWQNNLNDESNPEKNNKEDNEDIKKTNM